MLGLIVKSLLNFGELLADCLELSRGIPQIGLDGKVAAELLDAAFDALLLCFKGQVIVFESKVVYLLLPLRKPAHFHLFLHKVEEELPVPHLILMLFHL